MISAGAQLVEPFWRFSSSLASGLISKMVQTDSQTAAALIGVGGSLTALSALNYVLVSESSKERIAAMYVRGEFAQNMALISFIALPIFRNLWKVEAPLPLKFVSSLAYGVLGSVLLYAGYRASSENIKLLNGNEENSCRPEGSMVNLAFKVANVLIIVIMFYQKPADRVLTSPILGISIASWAINFELLRRLIGQTNIKRR